MKPGTKVVLLKSQWGHKKGERAEVVEDDRSCDLPLLIMFRSGYDYWVSRKSCRPIKSKVGAQRRAAGRKRPVVLDNGRSHEIAGCSAAVPASDNRRSAKAVAKKK